MRTVHVTLAPRISRPAASSTRARGCTVSPTAMLAPSRGSSTTILAGTEVAATAAGAAGVAGGSGGVGTVAPAAGDGASTGAGLGVAVAVAPVAALGLAAGVAGVGDATE